MYQYHLVLLPHQQHYKISLTNKLSKRQPLLPQQTKAQPHSNQVLQL